MFCVYNVVHDVVSDVTCCYFVHAFHGELLMCRKCMVMCYAVFLGTAVALFWP